MRILVTGGAGFIGSNFIRYYLNKYPDDLVVNYDKLTYAGNIDNLDIFQANPNYHFIKGDILDEKKVNTVIKNFGIENIVHFAAESHVDRSIDNPKIFVETNILGTQTLLNAAFKNRIKKFHHVSTDEVYGTLSLNKKEKFSHDTKYAPRSPYAASKASADHLVRAYNITYGLDVTLTNCPNNFGPYQDPEKFIPRMITNLIEGKKIPMYGDGKYVRDWIYVEDHCRAIDLVMRKGKSGETYLVGTGEAEVNNLKIAGKILKYMGLGKEYIEFIEDRPGHDRRYSIDSSKIENELGWKPIYDIDSALRETVKWYRENKNWWKPLKRNAEKFYLRRKLDKKAEEFTKYFTETSIKGLYVIDMPKYSDKRGFFREVVRMNVIEKLTGKKFNVKQFNHTYSLPRVIRALHAENWNKIVYPVSGKIFAAIVDVNKDSETFGKVETFEFDENANKAILIPKGLANSICVSGTEPVHYMYLVDKYYDGSDTTGYAWNDPDLKIKWPVKKPIISARDKNNPRLRDVFPDKFE